MDIPRTPPNRLRRRLLLAGGGVGLLAVVSIALARLEPAAPGVEVGTLWIDTVTRGSFVREVRGNGTLVPEEILWIPALSEGRVQRIVLRPGAAVEPDSVILEMSNPELEVRAREAELALVAAEADLTALAVGLEHALLDQQAQAAAVYADDLQRRLEAESNDELAREGLVSALQAKISRLRADEAATRKELEEKRLRSAESAHAARLA
ncbi:MAG TPA: RND transporter, partial [Thermoanaerobaculia bacterium]|nr:RND transporter [Thermoanaerobaculia bacterium]